MHSSTSLTITLLVVCGALLPGSALAGPWGPGTVGARSLLSRRDNPTIIGSATDRRTGDFAAIMFNEIDRILGELQNHTTVFANVENYLSNVKLAPVVTKLPSASHRADAVISGIIASLLTALRSPPADPVNADALATLYTDAMRLHMGYGQGVALEAMGYQSPQINNAGVIGLEAAKNSWAVLGVSGFEGLDFKAWATEANLLWTQLVGFASTYTGDALTSPGSSTPFARLMASKLPAWAKLDAVINFERDSWATRAALLAGKDAGTHSKVVQHVYWRWDAYFQAVLLDDHAAATTSLLKAFDALTTV